MEGDGRYQGDQCQLRLPNFRSEDLMDKVSAQPSLSIKGVRWTRKKEFAKFLNIFFVKQKNSYFYYIFYIFRQTSYIRK